MKFYQNDDMKIAIYLRIWSEVLHIINCYNKIIILENNVESTRLILLVGIFKTIKLFCNEYIIVSSRYSVPIKEYIK